LTRNKRLTVKGLAVVVAGMGQADLGSTGAYRPDYTASVIDAMNYLASLNLCPESRPYVLLMYSVATLSGLIVVIDSLVSTLRSLGVNCELDALKEATDIMGQAMGLIKSGKPSLEKAMEVSGQVMGLIKMLAFDLSACIALTVGLAGADVEGATG
jgi:hypothetical protein